jgi:putative nucleotidyltransferase with HDIG domain
MATSIAATPSKGLIWFTAPVVAVGLILIAYTVVQLPATPHPLGWVVLGGLALLAATFAIKIPGVSAFISISDTFFFASVLLFGPAPATISIALDSLILSWRRGFRTHQLLFNTASSAIALWSGAQVYYALGSNPPLAQAATTPTAAIFLPLAAMAGVYFLFNSGMTVIAVALDKRVAAVKLWRDNFGIISLNYFAAASASFFLIVLIQHAGVTGAIAIVPLISICYLAMRSWLGRVDDAHRHIDKVNQMYLSTIGAFSTAIEAKDGVTSDHVQRVQSYALGLARALGITDATSIQALEAAALLHDTGKLAVPEHILNKPGRLTPAEFATMQLHVDIGADILSSIDFPYPVVPIVRAHHENWDGTGYPRGLRGEEIPIGARILSVVDCFDALTSDRPYRPAMSEAQAIDIILERRGTMYDPAVVDMFIRVYRDIVPQVEARPALQSALGRIHRIHQPVGQLEARAPEAVVAPDCSDELLAFVSLARVTSRTATQRDVGILAWGYLRHLAPRTTFALLSVDPGRGMLVSQYAAGPVAKALDGLTIGVGQRVSGWVAANWRPTFNADARLDLDDRSDEVRFVASMPLIADDRLVGVLTLYSAEAFGDAQTRRLEMITPHVAAALGSVADPGHTRQAARELKVVARR